MARHCRLCGEPVEAHSSRDLTAAERAVIGNGARNPAEARSRERNVARLCPVVETAEGRWMPRRLAEAMGVAP